MNFIIRDWRVKYLALALVSTILLQISSSLLGIYISSPSEDIIAVWDIIASCVSFEILFLFVLCFIDIARTDLFVGSDEPAIALINVIIQTFEGGFIMAIGILPIIMCANLLGSSLVPDILKGLITFPFVIYLVYSVGEPTIFGSFFMVVGERK